MCEPDAVRDPATPGTPPRMAGKTRLPFLIPGLRNAPVGLWAIGVLTEEP
jgi:hypothetical protein